MTCDKCLFRHTSTKNEHLCMVDLKYYEDQKCHNEKIYARLIDALRERVWNKELIIDKK